MIRKLFFAHAGFALTLAGGGRALHAQAASQGTSRSSHDPESARLVTSDIPLFWRAYDHATLANAGDVLQKEYIDAGSPGVKDFVQGRLVSGRALAVTIASRQRFYAAIRSATLAVDTARTIKDSIRAAFRKLASVYPDAEFPDVYFVIGRLNSGGTTSDHGLLIGVEMNSRDDRTPTDELNDWERAVTGRLADLPHIVAHELVHVQQGAERAQTTLLGRALREGSADFIAELISGAHTNRVQRAYGDAHEAALWEEFRGAMRGTDVSQWLYQGDRSKGRPADLGYYMGYKIAESFYKRDADKRDAVRRILRFHDAEQFLAESGYAEKFSHP